MENESAVAPAARKRVLFLAALSTNRIGGIESFVAELALQLDRIGWDLTAIFQSEAQGTVREFLLAPGNVTLDVMKVQQGIGLANAREFLALLRKHRPSALMYWLGGVVRWWPLLARAQGVRRSLYYDGTSRTAAAMKYHAPPHVKLAMKPLSQQICATRFVKSCADREGIIPESKVRVIYSGIDNHREHGSASEFRLRHGIPDGRMVVLQISWLVPDKGIDVALRAAQRALQVRPDLQFVFCGDGAYRAEYEAMAQQLGIAGHVSWTGQIQDLVASGAFRAAAIQIQCSQWYEAFCLAVAEGMSAGLPVIASRIGGLPELVEDGVNGFLFEPRAEQDLAQAVLNLAADEGLRGAHGTRGTRTCAGALRPEAKRERLGGGSHRVNRAPERLRIAKAVVLSSELTAFKLKAQESYLFRPRTNSTCDCPCLRTVLKRFA